MVAEWCKENSEWYKKKVVSISQGEGEREIEKKLWGN